MKWIIAVAYIGTVFAANWAITHIGLVPVGFGLLAPAGVYFAGLAFTLRDLTHEALGRRVVLGAILVGALCSAFISPALAIASGTAFLVSELADFAVYTPLREKNWLGTVALSNSVGLVLDSVLFLALAFGSLAFLPGQIVGKAWMTALAVVVLWVGRRALSQRGGTRRFTDGIGGDADPNDGQPPASRSHLGGRHGVLRATDEA